MSDSDWLQQFDALVESGKVSYDVEQKPIKHTEGNLTYEFILTSALGKKPTIHSATSTPAAAPTLRPGSDIDTTGYELGPIGSHHFLAVNKFCYARPHLMLLTSNGHRRQHEPLHLEDLSAAWTFLQSSFDNDYVVFFNGGKDAGCSRMHKHMQMIPLSRETFASFLDVDDVEEPEVPFQWFHERFGKREVTPELLKEVYDGLMEKATKSFTQKEGAPEGAACPHNFLLTKRWMLVVPRREWGINKEAGVNAVGMIGLMPCASQRELDSWISAGVSKSLAEVAVPRHD